MTKKMRNLIVGMVAICMMIAMVPKTQVFGSAADIRIAGEDGDLVTNGKEYKGYAEAEEYIYYKYETGAGNVFTAVNMKCLDDTDSKTVVFVVYDEDGAEYYYNSTTSNDVFYVKLVEKSTYYFCVYGSDWRNSSYRKSADYKFKVTTEADVADDYKKAGIVSVGKEYKNQTLRTESDADYFKVKADSKASDYTLYVKNFDMKNFAVQLYDADGVQMNSWKVDQASERNLYFHLKAGTTYYIAFTSEQAGEYKFKVTNSKDEGNSKSKATAASLNKTYKKQLFGADWSYQQDVDYYKVNLTKQGTYSFDLKDVDIEGRNWNDISMTVYNSKGKTVATVVTYKGEAKKTTVRDLKAGTYYIKINSNYDNCGTYTFKVSKK